MLRLTLSGSSCSSRQIHRGQRTCAYTANCYWFGTLFSPSWARFTSTAHNCSRTKRLTSSLLFSKSIMIPNPSSSPSVSTYMNGIKVRASDYLAQLRRLASRCKFGAFLGEALRDRLVCGLNSENIQKVLLTKADLTLLSKSAAALKAKGPNSSVLAVQESPPANSTQNCPRCGRGKHDKSTCRFRYATCNNCGKVSHIAPVCRSKPAPPRPHKEG